MSTHYDNRNEAMTVTCDDCGKEDVFYGSFQNCVDDMKEEEWKISRDDASGDWFHYCEDCKQFV